MNVKNILFRCLQIFRSFRILPPPPKKKERFFPLAAVLGNKNNLKGITKDKCLLFQNRDKNKAINAFNITSSN